MNIVYDLFLNFQEKAYEFYEWSKQDSIEHVKKIPLVRVSEECAYDFLYREVVVSQNFLESIERLTERYDLTRLDYACLVSDGNVILAIEFHKDGHSMFKSRLLLEDEEEILRFAGQEEITNITYEVAEAREEQTVPSFFTRKEEKVKNFLEKEIQKTCQGKERSKLQYLYLEYFDEVEEDLETMKDKLLASMQYCLNEKHFVLYDLLLLLSKKKKV